MGVAVQWAWAVMKLCVCVFSGAVRGSLWQLISIS